MAKLADAAAPSSTPSLAEALAADGIESLYSHQAEAYRDRRATRT